MMKAFALLAACGLATLAGCQVSGEAEVETAGRPSASAEASAGSGSGSGAGASATAGYTMAYTATRDTEWRSGTDASATTGTLRIGDRVMFDRAPDTTMPWQQAKAADGRMVYVRPADFRAASK